MEIRFYNPEMNFIGVMENQTSLIWRRKFYEPGRFKLFTPLTPGNLNLTEKQNILWMRGSNEAAVIEDRFVEDSTRHAQIEATGRFISSYLDRRLIRPKISFQGTVEAAMRKILSDAEPIPRVYLGELNGFPETVSFQATYKNLLTYESKLARCANIGFRLRPNFNEKKLYFETYKGVDRSRSQSANHRVIFSENYENLNEVSFRENDQFYKNVVYIGGAGANDERIFVSFGTETGLERRELFVDARDITWDEGMTEAQYKEKLLQRGHEKQASEYEEVKTISCLTNANANFVYKTDYDLGDIVTVHKKSWGISADLRITEIEEIYERGAMKVSPVFGSVLPEAIDWRDD